MLRQRKPEPFTPGISKTSKTTDVEPSPFPSTSASTATSMHASSPVRDRRDQDQDPLLPPSSSIHPPPPSYDGRDHHQRPQLVDLTVMRARSQWLALAAASGACAAFNGVFAKLTTTELTTSWASHISSALGLGSSNKLIEILIRATFFALNLVFNGVMWALFTSALTRAPSTTRVSIVNTSSNFMLTALLGLIIFSESLPPLWWAGASLLVVGNVVIGRRDEGESSKPARTGDVESYDIVGQRVPDDEGGFGRDGKERDGENLVFLGAEDERAGELLELEDDMKGRVADLDSDDPVRGPSIPTRSL